jgi:hypothetical protein
VVLRLEVELARLPHAAKLAKILLAADRYVRMHEVRDVEHALAQLRLGVGQARFDGAGLLLEPAPLGVVGFALFGR